MQTIEELAPLILAGQGYELTVAPEAEKRKAELIALASDVTAVTSNDESSAAQRVTRSLAAMRIEVEKSRKTVKEPVNRIGKLIDQTAKNFLDEIEAEDNRIKRLVGAHAEEVARIQREKELAERKAFEEARAAREAAEAAAEAAANTGKLSDIIAAKQADKERLEAAAARLDASEDLAGTRIAAGVSFKWDFEVEDMDLVITCLRDALDITVKRTPILAWLKEMEADGKTVEDIAKGHGIRAFKKPVVSSR
jgi:vacuolar-type H+-ATPase subunit I/STV1